ncbi:MAG TPA: hypothetical protein VIG99_20170 [Myxococcaceae bacterium]|jgi:hypothetical protein
MVRRSLALVTLLLTPAAAWAGAWFGESDLYLQAGGVERSAVDAAGEMHADDVRLTVRSGAVSGYILGVDADLHGENGEITGTIGELPVVLHVAEAFDGTLAYDGIAGDQRLSGVVSPQAMSATLGPCRAVLGLSGRAYEGMLDCGATGIHPIALALPSSLSDSTNEEQVSLVLALLFAARVQTTPS